jgi:phosphate transport system substrate-binding protein
MKKIFAIAITVVLMGTLFTGCGTSTSTVSKSSSAGSSSSDVSSAAPSSEASSAAPSSEVSSAASSSAVSSAAASVASAASVTTTSTAIAAVKSSIASGTYTSARSVVLSTTTAGATIYYTTDGSVPTTISNKYAAAFSVAQTETVKAFAVKNGIASAVSTFAFVVNIPLDLSGTINYDGSSALAPLVDKAAGLFKVQFPKVSIPASGTKGSGTGVSLVLGGSIDIGGSDVDATSFTDAVTANTLVDHKICMIGFAAVVNKGLGITNLTTAQLVKVFTDKTIVTWNQVDPSFPSTPVTIFVRSAGSGTRVVFDSTALGGAAVRTDSVVNTPSSSGDMESKVNSTAGAIGYLALSYTLATNNVQVLSLNGVAPTYPNIYNHTYKVIGIEHIYTKGKPNATVQAFLDYMTSGSFAQVIVDNGYGLISKMQ